MFDFAWSEIALIGVVAVVLIGPKDLPVAIKAVSDMLKKARKMAGEFQGHVDEMVKDTSIAEVRQQINEIRSFDIRGEIERTVDADGSLRSAVREVRTDPFANLPPPPALPLPERTVPSLSTPQAPADAPAFIPPAFIPPGATPPAQAQAAPPAPPAPLPPAFLPPSSVAQGASRAGEASDVTSPGG